MSNKKTRQKFCGPDLLNCCEERLEHGPVQMVTIVILGVRFHAPSV